MSAFDHFPSIDNMIATIKKDFAAELDDAKALAAHAATELNLVKEQLKQALEDKDAAQRIAIKLITQFGMVEKIFSDAKALALQVEQNGITPAPEKKEPTPSLPPEQSPPQTLVTSPAAVTTHSIPSSASPALDALNEIANRIAPSKQ